MTIGGIDNSGLMPIRPQPGSESGANGQGSHDVSQRSSGNDRDRVEISSTARALANQSVSDVSNNQPAEGAISPDQLRTVLDRLGSGFYDRPDVQSVIAQRVQADLQG